LNLLLDSKITHKKFKIVRVPISGFCQMIKVNILGKALDIKVKMK